MNYRLPELNDKIMLHEYVQEHYDNGETRISAISLAAIKITLHPLQQLREMAVFSLRKTITTLRKEPVNII